VKNQTFFTTGDTEGILFIGYRGRAAEA